jgi:uncharacterized protein (TIGR03437 family)
LLWAGAALRAQTPVFTYVTIPSTSNTTSGNIQMDLISTLPNGKFVADNALATPFSIPSSPGNCGTSDTSPCNFYAFPPSSSGTSLTIDVSIANATDVYTLMNATSPPPGQQLGTIRFVGTGGASLTIPLVAGENIRDYYHGAWANTLTNGINQVEALNAFSCEYPTNCLGSGVTGNVQTGRQGTYVIDEQHSSLGAAFAGQTLTQIVLTDTYGGSRPLLLGVTVGSASPGIPAITSGGVTSASAFGGFTSVAPGSWIEIYGSNLASDTRPWAGADFSGVNAPASLDGTSVTIDGQAAFVDYISPGQVNAQVPSTVAPGLPQITVKTAGGTSSPLNITVNAEEPGLLAPASFNLNGIQYSVALFSDGITYVLPSGAISGVNSHPAKPGDNIVLYGVGFGPVTPDIPAGQIVQASNMLPSSFQVSIGGMPATFSYAGLAPNYVGLYQFNVVVPNIGASNAVPLTFSLDGAAGTQTLYIPVQN